MVNRVGSAARENDVWEFMSLGLGEPIGVSALHSRHTGDLLDAVVGLLPDAEDEIPSEEMAEEVEGADGIPGVAIVVDNPANSHNVRTMKHTAHE